MKNNPSADDLAVFLSVVREGGFRAAARQLGMAPSRVSATVTRIEARLGAPLMRRTTRSMNLTDTGRLLAERVAPLLAGLDAAWVEAADRGGRIRGRLTLNVPGAVMPDVLPPLLSEYNRRHPDVEVEVVVESELIDIVAAGCDAGIRYGKRLEKDMISVPVGPRRQEMALAASPGYIARRGRPEAPEELTRHDAIRYRLPDGSFLPWELYDGSRTIRVEPLTRLALGVAALDSGRRYAEAGMGIIQAFRSWLDEDLAAGTLVPVLPNWWNSLEGPYLYYPSRVAPAPLRAFIEVCRGRAAPG